MARYFTSETIVRTCDYCTTLYQADVRNLKRGLGLCCSKLCAAKMREREKKRREGIINSLEKQFNGELVVKFDEVSYELHDAILNPNESEINFDNWTEHRVLFTDEDMECTNNNSYGISEYKKGCIQHCNECEYYKPTVESIINANIKKQNQNENKNQLCLKRTIISGGSRPRAASILYRRGETTVSSGQTSIAKRFEPQKTRTI